MFFVPSCRRHLPLYWSLEAEERGQVAADGFASSAGATFTVSTEVIGGASSKTRVGSRSPFGGVGVIEPVVESAATASGDTAATAWSPMTVRAANRPPIPTRESRANRINL